MKSKPYKVNGKLFRYDYENHLVEYICKATAEELQEETEWKEKHSSSLFDIGEDGYSVIDTVGLLPENWKNKEARDEYLTVYVEDLESESSSLVDDFIKNELPYLNGSNKEENK